MSIIVSILSEWNGKALKNAQNQVGFFDKQLKRLAVTLGSAFSVRKIVQFSKASVKAFIEEDKAIRALGQNLSNLGLAYDVRPIEKYIRQLQYATGVADNELRPAFQQLVQATRNVSNSQELLALALDISAGTGKSLSQVTQGLSRAYLGNNTSLGRLNVGLTKAELKTKKFDDIVEDLSLRFKGQAKMAAQTYAGKLAILSAAADDAQEIIGQKLVQSLELLAGQNTNVETLANSFETMATDVGNIALGLSDVIKQVEKLGGGKSDIFTSKNLINAIPVLGSYLVMLMNRGEKVAAQLEQAEAERRFSVRRFTKEQLNDINKTLKGQKSITVELDKQQKLQLASKALTKSGDLMDMDKIQLAAAAQGKLTEGEKLRVEYMQKRLELEDAIAAKEANRALALANQLTSLEDRIMAFKPASPFDAWEQSILRMQNGLYNLGISEKKGSPGSLGTASAVTPEMSVFGGAAFITPELATSNPTGMAVNIKVEGSVYVDDFERRVVDAVVAASSGGGATNWYRTTGRATL